MAKANGRRFRGGGTSAKLHNPPSHEKWTQGTAWFKGRRFARKALEIATFEDGGWLENQAIVNGQTDDPLDAGTRAVLITSVSIYVQRLTLPNGYMHRAIAATICGKALLLVDEISPEVDSLVGQNNALNATPRAS